MRVLLSTPAVDKPFMPQNIPGLRVFPGFFDAEHTRYLEACIMSEGMCALCVCAKVVGVHSIHFVSGVQGGFQSWSAMRRRATLSLLTKS